MAAERQRIHASASFCIYLALMLLILPLRWIFAMVTAAAFHEFCHWAAIRILGKRVRVLRIRAPGASMELPEMSRGQELLCALAGPLGSFSLLFVAKYFPRVAICGAIQGLYNLLPLYPLDGGRVVYCLLSILVSPPNAKTISRVIERICSYSLLAAGFYATFRLRLGLLPVLIGFFCFTRQTSLNRNKLLTNV